MVSLDVMTRKVEGRASSVIMRLTVHFILSLSRLPFPFAKRKEKNKNMADHRNNKIGILFNT